MDEKEIEQDWLEETPTPDYCYRRVEFVVAELRDFGRDIGIVVKDKEGRIYSPAMSRTEAQKLFDKLWEFYFRPTEKKDG